MPYKNAVGLCGHPTNRPETRCRPCHYNYAKGRPRRSYSRLHTPVRKMSNVEAAWVGAMIEGEGSVFSYPIKKRLQCYLSVTNTEVETIATTLRLVGVGSVYASLQPSRKGFKTLWVWRLGNHDALRALVPQIIPFLTGKQDRAIAMSHYLSGEVPSAPGQ